MVRFLASKGAKIRVTDLRDARILRPSINQIKDLIEAGIVELILGKHRKQDFAWADIIVRNPAVKPGNEYIEYAKSLGKKIVMEMALFFALAPGLKLGVTGTRGKSTTTMLTYLFLKQGNKSFSNVVLAGNIGQSAVAQLDSLNQNSLTVLELSSFQLSVMRENRQSPNVAVVTNIYPDHLNWHPDMKHYVISKRTVVEFQQPSDFAVINLSNRYTRDFVNYTRASVYGALENPGQAKSKFPGLKDVYFYKDGYIHSIKRGRVYKLPDQVHLKGKHNMFNILLAYITAKLPIFKVPDSIITKVLEEFKGLPGRQEYVGSLNGVDFYNDTAATMQDATVAAIERFSKQYGEGTVMIIGGMDKGLGYEKLASALKESRAKVVLLEGSASEKIAELLDKENIKYYGFYSDIYRAVQKAYELASGFKKSCVVLSPGAASFNMFANEWDRGDKFKEAVSRLGAKLVGDNNLG